jgi:uncharacterized protein (TIGR00251 family)
MRISVKVIPRAGKTVVERIDEKSYRVRLTAAPVDGEANETLIAVLSKHFHVAKSCITILQGHKSRQKVVEIEQ